MTTPFARFSLRTRLFLIFGGLVALFVFAQAWLMRSLSLDLSDEMDRVVLDVGSSVADFLTFEECGQNDEGCQRTKALMRRGSAPLQPHVVEGSGLEQVEIEKILRKIRIRGKEPHSPATSSKEDPDVDSEPEARGEPSDELHEVEDSSEITWSWSSSEHREGSTKVHEVTRVHRGEAVQRFLHFNGEDLKVNVAGDAEARVLLLELSDLTAEVPIPRSGLKKKIERFQQRLWLGTGLLLVIGLLAAGMTAHRVAAPLGHLADAAERVGEGELGVQVSSRGGGPEVRRTVTAFNAMSSRLSLLREKNRRLEALRQLEEIGDVARGVAHSLRNPLNALGLSIEELAGGEKSDSREGRLAAAARRQINRLDAGIRSFLLLASPGDATQTESVAVDELIRDVALEVLQDAGGRVGVDLELDEVEEPILLGVAAELRAVVQALVVNAVEASSAGQRVCVRLLRPDSSSASALRLEVDDQGPGLSAEIRQRLFTPHLSTKPTGSGMGLFLAQRIASYRYGGSLELLDLEGGGIRARLDLGPRRELASEAEPMEEAGASLRCGDSADENGELQ